MRTNLDNARTRFIRRGFFCFGIIWFLAFLANCTSGNPTIDKAPRNINKTTVQARLDQAYKDMAEGDVDKLMNLYAPDAIIQSPGEPAIAGTKAIRTFWKTTFLDYRVQITPEVYEVSDLGEHIVVRGRAYGNFQARKGKVVIPVDSWFLQVYILKEDGTLLFWRGANGLNPQR